MKLCMEKLIMILTMYSKMGLWSRQELTPALQDDCTYGIKFDLLVNFLFLYNHPK